MQKHGAFIPRTAPARVQTPAPVQEHPDFRDQEGHPNAPHVFIRTANGSATIAGLTMRAITSTILGSMGTFPGESAAHTSGTGSAETLTVASGSMDSISASRTQTSLSATIGFGIAMTSSSMTIRTILVGTWLTT